jgi:cytochrome P450
MEAIDRNHSHTAAKANTMELSLASSLMLCILSFFYFLYRKQEGRKNQHDLQMLRVYPIVGTLPHFIKNRNRFLEWSAGVMQSSPTHSLSLKVLGRRGGIFTANPLNVEHITKANFGNYPKGDHAEVMDDFLGHGIFNSDGEQWQQQRKLASYEFNKRSHRDSVVQAVRFEVVERLLPLLEKAAAADGRLDLQDMLERFAFDNICRVAFGEDPACLTEENMGARRSMELMHAFDVANTIVMYRFIAPEWLWRLMRLLNVGPERQMRKALTTIHGFADKIVRERAGVHRDDLLSRFADSGEHSNESLRYVITNFILAGRDSSSAALTWLFWLVSTRPDVEDKILNEIRAVRASTSTRTATFSFDELREMQYIQAAITESMRLYPPVPINSRTCSHDDVLPDGTFVGKGWGVAYSAYAMGRVEDVWGKDSQEFRPERWLDDGGAFRSENPSKYPVFHAGPRMCLGKEMAYIQMKSIVACVLERFSIRYLGDEGRHPGLLLAGTLRMAGGLPMQVKERS